MIKEEKMGNVAIAFIEVGLTLSDNAHAKRLERIEHKRIRSLVPRCGENFDESITTVNLNGVGVNAQVLRMLSDPLIAGQTRVRELFLERNQIGPEGAMVIARVLSRNHHLKNVSLAHNPGEGRSMLDNIEGLLQPALAICPLSWRGALVRRFV